MTLSGEATVASPCNNVCKVDVRTGWCEGCLRTLDEIASWSVLDDAEKRAVWTVLEQRRAGHQTSGPITRPEAA